MRIGGRWTGTFNLLKLRVGQILPFRTTTAANFPTLVLYCLGKDWRQSSCISMETWSQQDASIPVQCCTNTSSLLLVLKPAQYLYCTQWITLYKKKVTGYSHGYGSLEHSCLVTECRESSKSEKKKKKNKLAGGQLMCHKLKCSHFSKSLNTSPAVLLTLTAPITPA